MNGRPIIITLIASLSWLLPSSSPMGLRAAEVVIELGRSDGVVFVGAIQRWDAEGAPLAPVDPKAKIDAPKVTAKAERQEGRCHPAGGVPGGDVNRWVLSDLPAGKYDLVIITSGNVRVEGFHYPPVLEFDPFLPATAKAPPDEARDAVVKDIAESRFYENKVTPLFLAGDAKQVRGLVQLVRDQPTSYDAEFGTPAATVRHEIWQYTYRYGGWVRERSVKVLDRILLANSELQRWSWMWEPQLGGIEVKTQPVKVVYELPRQVDSQRVRGWVPK